MDILEKYERIRPFIKHGDLILFHGTGIIARTIQYCDRSYWNHIGVVVEVDGALFIVDSNENGVQADRLSWRVAKYKNGDFALLRSNKNRDLVRYNMGRLLQRADAKWIRYDFINGAKEMLNRRFGWKLEIKPNEDRDICSDWVRRYAEDMEIVTEKFKEKVLVFPEDYQRFLSPGATMYP